MVVAGDDSEEKRQYQRDNSSGSGSVITIRKAEENHSSDKEDENSVVQGKSKSGTEVEQGPGARPRMNHQDSPINSALVLSSIPVPNSPSISREDTTSTNTRIPSPPSSPPTTTVPTAPSSSYVTQYSEPVVIPPGHVWLAGRPNTHLSTTT